MKKCYHCGTPWEGFGAQPRERERCSVCRRHFHCCVNCHHLDTTLRSACRLKHTAYVGNRETLNYCEEFKMLDSNLRASEDRVSLAKSRWEQLFSR
jgi:hypothetical protein